MKRYLISGLTLTLAALAIASSLASSARAGQTHLNDPAADLNGDGVVTIGELVRYNRDQRD
ncbi:MAG TPA: hypothetical protein VLS96_14695 [Nodosilinea sp.]|nr:hypothetical protein [Nodosilinea sp.]